MQRQTGKTFRALLKALLLASEGKDVIYECIDHNMARWTFEKAAQIVSAVSIKTDSPCRLTLRIGEGSIKFVRKMNDRERDSMRLRLEIVSDLN